MRKTYCYGRGRTWVNIAVRPCLHSFLTQNKHHPFENKVWEIYIKKCIRSFIEVVIISWLCSRVYLYTCSCIMDIQQHFQRLQILEWVCPASGGGDLCVCVCICKYPLARKSQTTGVSIFRLSNRVSVSNQRLIRYFRRYLTVSRVWCFIIVGGWHLFSFFFFNSDFFSWSKQKDKVINKYLVLKLEKKT